MDTAELNRRILVVDDEEIMRDLLSDYLDTLEFNVDTAVNGKLALDKINENGGQKHYDLVITDIYMPELDGIQLQKTIKKTYPDLPVIFMTGYGVEKVKQELNGHTDGFLMKPFELSDLLNIIKEILKIETDLDMDFDF